MKLMSLGMAATAALLAYVAPATADLIGTQVSGSAETSINPGVNFFDPAMQKPKNPNLAGQKDDAELSDKELDKVTGGHAHHHKAPTTSTQTTTPTWDLKKNKAL